MSSVLIARLMATLLAVTFIFAMSYVVYEDLIYTDNKSCLGILALDLMLSIITAIFILI